MKGVPFLRKISKQLDFGVEPPYVLKTLLSTTQDECTLIVTLCHSSMAASVMKTVLKIVLYVYYEQKEDEINWPAIVWHYKTKM